MNSNNQLTKFTNQWFVTLLITFGIATAFYWYDAIIVKTMGDIQFSTTLQGFNNCVAGFLDTIKPNIYYDFLFIIAYTILFYLAYRVFQSSMRIPVSKLGIILCLVPGVFDIVENILLLGLLNNTDSTGLFNVFWLVARVKWTLIIPFFIINVTILVYYLLRLINSFVS